MAFVFTVEILKPQSWDHISVLSRADWIFLSASLGDECLVQIALSSANWQSDRFGTSPRASSRVFMMTLNKIGLRTLPWGQPFSRSWMSDVSFPTLTCIFLPFKKLCIQWNIFPFIPKSFNFMSVPVVHIRSKAFSRSRVTAAWHLFSIKAIFISDSRRTSWSIVDLCFLKPLWLFERWPFFSRWELNLLATIVSIVLQMADVRDIGLYDWGFNLSLCGFIIGIMVAIFHSEGISPLSQEIFINLINSFFDGSGSCLSIS